MKRVISFDFLRGVAIIGVLLFHLLNVAFAQRVDEIGAALDGNGTLPPELFGWYIIGPVLIVLGSFNGLFLMISAASNAISVGKQWERLAPKHGESAAFNLILRSQVIRGALIWGFGYLSEGLFGTLIGAYVDVIAGAKPVAQVLGDIGPNLIESFYLWNILYTIGISIILTSLIQLLHLRGTISRKAVSWLLIVVVAACIVLQPVARELVLSTLGTDTFSSNLDTITVGEKVVRLILAPFVGRLTPLIPFFSCAAIGLLISINITSGNITAGLLRKFLHGGLLLFLLSFPIGAIFGFSLGDRERHVFYHVFILGLETMSMTFILYMVDFRKKTRIDVFNKLTAWARRFGVMTLTLWNLQYFMVFPAIAIELVTGWPILGLSTPAIEDYGGLVEWQLVIVLGLIFLMWHTILWVWQKAGFKGSFEWLVTKILAGGAGTSSGDRAKFDAIINNPEKMIEHRVAEGPKIDPKERGLIIANIIAASFLGFILVLVGAGVISL